MIWKDFFAKYDYNGSGKVDTNKELTQLVTNLAFSLKMGASVCAPTG